MFYHAKYELINDELLVRKSGTENPTFQDEEELIIELSRFIETKIQNDYGLIEVKTYVDHLSSTILASADWKIASKLCVIIQNASGSQLGIFSRTLCKSEGISKGTWLSYIEEAISLGFAVMLLRPNTNSIWVNKEGGTEEAKKKRLLFGSESPEQHVITVWENLIYQYAEANQIVLIGYGNGASLCKDLVTKELADFQSMNSIRIVKVFTIEASFLSEDDDSKDLRSAIQNIFVNFETHPSPKGHRTNKARESLLGCRCISLGHDQNRNIENLAVSVLAAKDLIFADLALLQEQTTSAIDIEAKLLLRESIAMKSHTRQSIKMNADDFIPSQNFFSMFSSFASLVHALGDELSSSIRFISFTTLVSLDSFPRFPDHKDLTISLQEITEDVYDSSLFIFVSHCWFRLPSSENSSEAVAIDNEDHHLYQLCIHGIDQIWRNFADSMKQCYLWIDYSCIDQNQEPGNQMRSCLRSLIQICDCFLIPIYDPSSLMREKNFDPLIEIYQYSSPSWKSEDEHQSKFCYLNRSWCRLEMSYATKLPLLSNAENRSKKFRNLFSLFYQGGVRPQLIYGSQEHLNQRLPLFLFPQNKLFDKNTVASPENGYLTREIDRPVIEDLMKELRDFIYHQSKLPVTFQKHDKPPSNQPAGTVPFSLLGIRVSFLKSFLSRISSEQTDDFLSTATTTDICEKIIKPKTTIFQCSMCELLQYTDSSAVGVATAFISHAWKYKFIDVVQALLNYFQSDLDRIIWFDVFSNNQHKVPDLDFQWWCNTFMSAIGSFEKTVMVLSPWNNPIPLTRGWCIWELYCTIETNRTFEIAMTLESEVAFVEDIDKRGHRALQDILGSVDCIRSNCFKQEDKERIHSVIKAKIGFAELNQKIIPMLRKWVLQKYQNEYEKRLQIMGQAHEQTLLAMHQLGSLYGLEGEDSKAVSLLEPCLKDQIRIRGESHNQTLQTMNMLFCVYRNQGNYLKAEPLILKCVEIRNAQNGLNHPETLTVKKNLSSLFLMQGKYSEAEGLLVACLEGFQKSTGENHLTTLETMMLLGDVYRKLKKKSQAELLLETTLEKCKTHLGISHLSTYTVKLDLGSAYIENNKFSKAEPLLLACLKYYKYTIGSNHPKSLTVLNSLGVLYSKQKKFSKAEPFYSECFDARKKLLGPDHPLTLGTMNNLAYSYANIGQYQKAESLFVECLERGYKILGNNHPEIKDYESNYSFLCRKAGFSQISKK